MTKLQGSVNALTKIPDSANSANATSYPQNYKTVIIPHHQLAPETLQALVEDFVTRSGTDYGEIEASLAEKVQQVVDQLAQGEAVIVFDAATETCNITLSTQLPQDD